jgi:L-asparaginase II
MSAAADSLVTKIGAEGYHGIGVLPGKARGFSTSLGIAIKIGDGDLSLRAGCVVALQVLRHLGVLDEDQLRSLPAYDRRPLTNWRGIEIGEIRPSAELLAALSHFPA